MDFGEKTINRDPQNEGGKLHSLKEWIDILNAFKLSHRGCETNCYIPLPVLGEYIKEKRLFYKIVSGHTLWLFERERDYYLGYYYVSKNDKLVIERQDLDVIIYLIGSGKKYAYIQESELVEQGCVKYRRNQEYVLTSETVPELEKMNRKCRCVMNEMGLHYTTFHAEDYETVYQLWRERIDRYSVKDMLKSRIRQMEEKEECLMIRNGEGTILAATSYEVNGSVALSENIATVASIKGMGIGSALASKLFLNIFSKGCTKNCVWIWENNVESKKLTRQFVELTGRFSQQLLLRCIV